MSIEFRTPSESDIALMKEFAQVVDAGMSIALKPEMAHVAHDILKKLQEALFWFSHGVLNKPVAPVAESSATAVLDNGKPVEVVEEDGA